MAKVLAFEVEIGGISGVVNDLGSLEKAIKATNAELKGAKIGSDEYNRLQKQLGSLKQVQADVRKDTRLQSQEFVRSADAGKKSYRALNAELVNLRSQFKDLSAAERNGKIGQDILKNIQLLDKELKQIDASIGNFQRNVGNYRSALTGLGNLVTGGLLTGGITAVLGSATRFLKESITLTADFNRQIGILGAVSGASADELERLEKAALDLGSSTEFTASQVAQLEIEYAKLGFTAPQILDLLGSTLDAATVSGSELADTAVVVGTAIRAFGLEAEDSQRVTDVLGQAFSSTSLDLGKFETALAQVGATGNAVGLSIEEVTALLGTLTDSGFRAESAGTALRNIFLKNAQAGLTFNEALEELSTSQDLLVDSADRYGVQGAAQGLVLAENIDKFRELTTVLQESEGFTANAAATIRNDLSGALAGFTSALQGLQISLGQGLEPIVRGIVNVGSDLLRVLGSLFTVLFEVLGSALQPTVEAFRTLLNVFSTLIPAVGEGVSIIDIFSTTLKLAVVPIEVLSLLGAELVNIIASISNVFTSARDSSENLSSGFTVLKDIVTGLVQSFLDIPNLLRGIINAAKAFGTAIKNLQFDGIGENITNAFNRGFNNVSTEGIRSDFDKARESMENAFNPKKPQEFADELTTSTDKITKETGKSTTAFGALQKRLSDVSKSLQDAILQGSDYTELLKEYETLSTQVSEAQAKFKAETDALNNSILFAEGSVTVLNKQVSELKKQLETTNPENIEKITSELIAAEKQLAEAQLEIQRARQVLAGGSDVLQQDINNELSAIELVKQTRLNALVSSTESERQQADIRKQINLEAEIETLEQRVNLFRENTAQRLAIETELAEKRKALESTVISSDVSTQIADVNAVRDARILAIDRANTSEESYQRQRTVLEQAAALQILQIRLNASNLSNEDSLALSIQLKDAEVALERSKNEEILASRQELISKTTDILSEAFSNLNQVGQVLEGFQDARFNKEASRIEELYDRQLERVSGNAEETEKIETEKDAALEKLAKEQFERNKKLQIGLALISGAQALLSTLSANPGAADIATLGIIRAVQAAIVIATTAAQIAKIRSQTFAEGGYTGKGYGKADHTGYKPAGIVHENEYVVPEKVMNNPQGKYLVSKLESMRKGQYNAYKDYVSAKTGAYATGGFVQSSNTPNVSSQGVMQVEVMLSDDQVSAIAQRVGEQVYLGVVEGTIEAENELVTINERRQRLQNNIN